MSIIQKRVLVFVGIMLWAYGTCCLLTLEANPLRWSYGARLYFALAPIMAFWLALFPGLSA